MARLIVHVVFLVLFAILVVFNLPYRTAVNVFGSEIENVSVITVMLLAFVAGALYALFAFFTYTVGRRKRLKQKGRTLENRQKEQLLNDREKDMDALDRIRRDREKRSPQAGGTDSIPGTS